MKIHQNDTVIILSGKDKGRQGKVLSASPLRNSLLVEGINLFKKHLKKSQNQSGGIITKEFPIAVSKVKLICPHCHKPTRVGFQVSASAPKQRLCRLCKQIIIQSPAKKA